MFDLVKIKTRQGGKIRPMWRHGSPSRAATRTDMAEISELSKKIYKFFSEQELPNGDYLEHKNPN
jgi:hypothetical protein